MTDRCGIIFGNTMQMLDLLLEGKESLVMMNKAILAANRIGTYSGAFRAVELALGNK